MPNRTNGSLEETFVSTAAKPPGLRVWKLNPEAGRPSRAAIFLDGELYLEKVKAVPLLKQLERVASIPPTLAVFVSGGSAEARHSDYTCDSDYADFLSQDVGNQETDSGISHPPSGMLQLTSQIEACERGCNALSAGKYKVYYRIFNGGHEQRWREDLALALPWASQVGVTNGSSNR
jgi:enterochelin esterase-like enzyme